MAIIKNLPKSNYKKNNTSTSATKSTANDTYRYTIGSEKGKDIAQNLSTGEKYQCSDGSVWTKQPDGSVSVNYNGQTYDNAYKPTSTGSGNSQYTTNTYTPTTTNNAYHYTIGSDKGKEIANNLPIGDTYQCSDGSVWTKNDDGSVSVRYNGQTYHNAYQMDDIGSIGLQQMDAGLDWRILQDTLDSRVNKALTTNGLEQYAYDDIYKQMSQYISNAKAAENQQNNQSSGGGAQSWGNSYVQSNPQPTYNSKYDPEIDKLLSEILSRDDFSYDAQNDPLYQQYSRMYQREGDRAMRETLAEAASGAGGMNTYAVTAAQQAANRYASQLNDKIPELYQLAYEMYLADKDSKVQDLGILQDMDTTQYNRYRDTMSDYKNDRNFAYGLYQDDVAQGNWQKTFDYNAMIDDRNFNYNAAIDDRNFNYNSGWDDKKWNANQDQIALENSRYEQDTARDEVWRLIELGVTPSADLIQKAGMSQSDVNLAVAAVQAQAQSKSKTGGGYTSGNTPSAFETAVESVGNLADKVSYVADEDAHKKALEAAEPDNSWTKGLTDLGLGLVYSPELIVELAELGAVYEENGKLKWADGWNAQNFQTKLNNQKAYNNILPTF